MVIDTQSSFLISIHNSLDLLLYPPSLFWIAINQSTSYILSLSTESFLIPPIPDYCVWYLLT